MEFLKYYKQSKKTRKDAPEMSIKDATLLKAALGLTEEAGEVAGEIKKALIYGRGIDKEALTLELGDVLYYITWIADLSDISMEAIFKANLDKVNSRWANALYKGSSND